MDTTLFTFASLINLALTILLLNAHAQAEISGPCQGCRLFNWVHRHDPVDNKKDQTFCHYPCQCPVEALQCHDGVNRIKDGCGCCYMCARQLGDMCSVRDKCDIHKGLYCTTDAKNETGICKGKNKKPCHVLGSTYSDGEKFYMGCSQMCTCQNGFYGCVSVCPQEQQKPSSLTCHEPKLIKVKNKCCKEWTCPKLDTGHSILSQRKGLESENLVAQNPMWYRTSSPPTTTSTASVNLPSANCHARSTDWSPCSVTCDVGVSVRTIVDPTSCHNFQERQLCYLRPCGVITTTLGRSKCTPTTRNKRRHHLRFQDCISVKEYKLKFCTNCKKKRCCYPKRTRSKPMEFQCSGGKRETMVFQWIKKCKCTKACYQTKRGRGRRRERKGKRRNWRKQRRRQRSKGRTRKKV